MRNCMAFLFLREICHTELLSYGQTSMKPLSWNDIYEGGISIMLNSGWAFEALHKSI